MKSQPSIKNTYRPDIDGLRAVAVLSVVLYHAGFSTFSGGFVGVDVFFVISGFLITRLLVNEVHSTNKIDYARFYLRRSRRLLPAMFFTLICTTILGVWFLSPQQLESYGASLLHSVLSLSNIYFYSESGYFDTASSLKPLLHTWSLGVEEQFYFIWPFMLSLFASKKLGAPVLVAIVGVVSFYFSYVLIADQPDAVFFMTPFRVFEFSIGAALVWFMSKGPNNNIILDILLLIGLALIAFAVFGYNETTRFPGVNALLPCIGAAICIYAGNAKYVGKVLSNKLFVGIGLISYSLYLAHWPLMVFYKNYINIGELRTLESMLLVAVSLVCAVFMYFFIEKPFRTAKPNNSRFIVACTFFALALCYIGASMWAAEGWNWRTWATSGSISIEAAKEGKELRFVARQQMCERKGWDVCDLPIKGDVNALVIGDSHAVDALNAFGKTYPEHNLAMSDLGGCPPYKDIESITQPNHPDRMECKKLNETRYNLEYLKGFDYIVINVLFGWYTPDHLREYLTFLQANDIKKVIVLGDYLVLTRDMYELLNEFGYDTQKIFGEFTDSQRIEKPLRRIVESFGYFFLSKRDVFCVNEQCELFDTNGVPFTYDQHHLSYEFSTRLVSPYKAELDLFLSGLNVNKSQVTSEESSFTSEDFYVSNWGPQSAYIGEIPNVQPNGGMGMWIQAPVTREFGKAQLLFGDQLATVTTVQKGLITAAIAPELLSRIGKREIFIKQLSTGKLFPVGSFYVRSANK